MSLDSLTSVDTTKCCFNTTGMVYSSTRKCARHWHGTNKGRQNVAHAYGKHLLGCIYGLSFRYNRINILLFIYCYRLYRTMISVEILRDISGAENKIQI